MPHRPQAIEDGGRRLHALRVLLSAIAEKAGVPYSFFTAPLERLGDIGT